MRAPRIDEVERKKSAGDYPYWREYRNQLRRGSRPGVAGKLSRKRKSKLPVIIGIGLLLTLVAALSLAL